MPSLRIEDTAPFDMATFREGLAAPGMDTRQWVSYGLVQPDTPDSKAVQFIDDETGDPLDEGVLVLVKLEPSGTIVNCRVGAQVAGNGESDYYPFIEGDEVLVVIPQGNERAGCMIIARCNQALDKFPLKVAGQDVTKNSFAFRRTMVPYIFETASSYMIRSALTGAGFTIDQKGSIFVNSGDKHMLAMSPDVILLQEGTGTTLLQIDPHELSIMLQADQVQFKVDPSGITMINPGNQTMSSGGFFPVYHLMTFEAVVNLFQNMIGVFASLPAPVGTAFAAIQSVFMTQLLAASVLPTTGMLTPSTATAMQAAILAQSSPPYGLAALADAAGIFPGVCRTTFLVS